MQNKNLPIKIFEKRKDVDERFTEGGGNDVPPRWLLEGEKLRERAFNLSNSINNAKNLFAKRKKEREFIPVVLKTEINLEALAKSHRKEISNFFKFTTEGESIIGFSGEQELMVKIDGIREIDLLNNKLEKYEKNSYVISAIEEISQYEPDIIIPENLSIPLKIKLINYHKYELNSAVMRTFENIINNNKGLNLKSKTMYTDELVVYKVVANNSDSVEEIKQFEGLYSIEPMPSYDIVLDYFEGNESSFLKEPVEGKEYPVIGVLDTGIEKIPQLNKWILDDNHTNYPQSYIDKGHGTFVSGIILYGDQLQNEQYTGMEGCKLFDATIFPDTSKERIDQDDLIRNIREAVGNNCNRIKIWNLSIGTRDECEIDKFSDFGIALDNIQDDYNVIICKSVGNCNAFISGAPKSRIAQSADSVRSIVVGSIAHEKSQYDIADINNPSPFTRIGPGPGFIVKPDLVHYGGNAGINNGNLVLNGVKSFAKDGRIIKNCGTSFSTPRVTSILAGLNNNLDEEFDPLLIKGLLIHSASFPSGLNLPDNERINQLGFGVPKATNEVLYNSPYEVTLVLRDCIEKGNFIEILDFPYPESLIQDGYYTGQIVLTLVNNPILEPSQGIEYCQSNLEVKLGTYDEKVARDITKPNIKNPIGRQNSQNILNQACFSKKVLQKRIGDFCAKERLLVQYGDKYHPTKKYAIDLSDMKQSYKMKNLKCPKKWYLKISGLYRDFIEKEALIKNIDLSQDFCLIITIKDPNEKHKVYNDVTELLNRYNFIHNDIKVKQKVRVSVSNSF